MRTGPIGCTIGPVSDTQVQFGVRVGDDGRWHLKTNDAVEARKFAAKLSTENWSGKAQIVEFTTGRRCTYRDGVPAGGSIQW